MGLTLLKQLCDEFVQTHVHVTNQRITGIESLTKDQSKCQLWYSECRVRLSASKFANTFSRRPQTLVKNLVKNILNCSFKGNVYTRYGLDQKANTSADYIWHMFKIQQTSVVVYPAGLAVSKEDNCLCGSPDALVTDSMTKEGLAELKNVPSHKDKTIQEYFKLNYAKSAFPLKHLPNSKTHNFFYKKALVQFCTTGQICHCRTYPQR